MSIPLRRDDVSAIDAAVAYLRRGWQPVPVPHRQKAPTLPGWQRLHLTEADLAQHFNGRPSNVGVLLGRRSGGLIDVDLDCGEALALADAFLPNTGAVFGRASKCRSHRLYRCDPPPRTLQCRDIDGAMLVELRSDGGQTVFPPSVHPSGELVAWDTAGEPAAVAPEVLVRAVRRLAAAALLARHWPSPGSRHDAALALSGALLRAGWSEAETTAFLVAVAAAAGDEEAPARARDVASTARRLAAGGQAVGLPSLRRFLPAAAVDRLTEWLALPSGRGSPAASEAAEPEGASVPWPTLDSAALYGLAGDVVRAIAPSTEADRVALLLTFLSAFGAALGPSAYCPVGAEKHPFRIWCVLVGHTAKGRKGSSWAPVRAILERADPAFAAGCILGGLSTGEGLIWAIRDPILGRERVKQGGTTCYREMEVDPGVADKRLLVVEEEFSAVLKVLTREGNTLSAVLRQAWDRGDLRILTKNSPARATGAHIVVVGHAVAEEIRRYLAESEMAGGFGNRFLWACVRRSKCLPRGSVLDPATLDALAQHVAAALAFGRTAGRVDWSDEAGSLWDGVYPELSEGKPGLAGAMTARLEAHALRLAGLYAVLDGSRLIRPDHLAAALAIVDYCEASARWIFGDSLGDAVADAILQALRRQGELSRWAISELFGRHVPSQRIGRALQTLQGLGLAEVDRQETGGRPAEVWRACRG